MMNVQTARVGIASSASAFTQFTHAFIKYMLDLGNAISYDLAKA